VKNKYPLADLLRVRKLREDKALEAITVAQRRLEDDIRYLEEQKKALESFRAFRISEEVRLYNTIMKQIVKQEKVDEVKAEVTRLRLEELAHMDRVTKAEEELEAAKKNLEQAKIDYQNAIKSRQKIDEHKAIWKEVMAKEEEFKLEKEMEDFRTRVPSL
jgi:type III secretion protein O